MNSINTLFLKKAKNVLSIYFTAGYPELNDTSKILSALKNHGADLIEIGMPYSDPLADGPVIQKSGMHALRNGMTIEKLFAQLNDFKKNQQESNKDFPLILMGYLNPVLQFGFEKFCRNANEAGISGIILPDLPIIEYEKNYKQILDKYDLSFIFLITPETSEARIRKIDSLSNGFIYAVSSSSVTGGDTDMNAQEQYFKKLESMNLSNKILIGFGIRNHETFTQACKHATGAIIGSAYIKALSENGTIEQNTQRFLNSILQAE